MKIGDLVKRHHSTAYGKSSFNHKKEGKLTPLTCETHYNSLGVNLMSSVGEKIEEDEENKLAEAKARADRIRLRQEKAMANAKDRMQKVM